ncbi:MAG: cation transporter [Planctomycetota bacterium]|nr:MAG: cation transporter [Planctomycetota bacterium]
MTGCGCDDEVVGLERRTLWTLLVINAVMFAAEAALGWLAESTALLADSLDMGADAAVYGVALYAVGRSRSLQARAATTSGVLQIALGLGVLVEVARRSVYGSEPISLLIIVTGLVALVANVLCLVLIGKQLENPAGDSEKADSEHPPSTGPSNCAHDWNTDAAFVARNWTRLPDSVRAAIITLVRALL